MNRSTRAQCRTRPAASRASGACANHTWHDAAVPRVLITGISGFAGSHLAEHLLSRGDEVHGLAYEDPPFRNLAAVATRVRVHRGDITRLEEVGAAFAAAAPDGVVHLAGQAVPTLASADPIAAVEVNVLGTATVLTALAAQPRARLVVAS